jgi:hypothetical protein
MVTTDKPLTAKQEGFAQSIVAGLSQTEAYKANYHVAGMLPATVNRNAFQVSQVNKVATRISEIKATIDAQVTSKRVWDKVRFIDEAEKNLSQSRALDQMAPANSALSLIGKATGILVDETKAIDTALDAVLKVAAAMSEVALRARASGRQLPAAGGQVVDGESTVIEEGT